MGPMFHTERQEVITVGVTFVADVGIHIWLHAKISAAVRNNIIKHGTSLGASLDPSLYNIMTFGILW